MRLAELVAAVHAQIDPREVMAEVAAISEYDRYQASAGIAGAAAYVADRALAAGLTDVAVLSFPADGAQRWWTYRAPLPWTPVRASLACRGQALISYPEQPYALAANSASIPGGQIARCVRWSAVRAGADPAGSLVVVDGPAALPAVAGSLAAAGAVAVAMDVIGARPGREPGQIGRIELPAGSRLAGFSLTAAQLAWLAAAADQSAGAVLEVEVDLADYGLPVVTGRLPGDSDDELLLTAHLCHPRPGANDNASGVAALLGTARALAAAPDDGRPPAGDRGQGPGRPGVRFVWGPEFVGVAAYLHDVVQAGKAAPPVLAVNVDMAGQDVRRCGGPLVIERGPDDLPSFLPALAQRCAALLPPASRSYSGAVPCDPWTWRATPFAGASDHALVADVPTRCPAIALGHWPDRLNHSSADTISAVDPAELRRTTAIACAVAAAVRGRSDEDLAADVAEATASWAAEHVLATLPGSRLPAEAGRHTAGLGGGWAGRAASSGSGTGGPPPRTGDRASGEAVLDARVEASAWRWLEHRVKVAVGAVQALGLAGVPAVRITSAAQWITAIAAVARDRPTGAGHQHVPAAAQPIGPDAVAAGTSLSAELDGGTALHRCWPGPVNLRALADAAAPADRAWLDDQLALDRGGNYARAVALLLSVNGERDRHEMAWWAALSSELPVPVSFAARFTDLICRAGWAALPESGGR